MPTQANQRERKKVAPTAKVNERGAMTQLGTRNSQVHSTCALTTEAHSTFSLRPKFMARELKWFSSKSTRVGAALCVRLLLHAPGLDRCEWVRRLSFLLSSPVPVSKENLRARPRHRIRYHHQGNSSASRKFGLKLLKHLERESS